MKQERHSKQRELIIENLRGRTDHPTAETLYDSLKDVVSLPTVYRNLAMLCEAGKVQRIRTEGQPDRFDGNVAEHTHFLCEECGAVLDVVPSIEVDAAGEICSAGQVHGYSLLLHGTCNACLHKHLN